ncbi:hypothetical protein [Nonomuraea sp. NPDC049695]|uniref:hypothetical protein n=1 Tax=Nonomuraea sp. NPDC049695 TaxID=3154734 RepID=UPI003429F6B0
MFWLISAAVLLALSVVVPARRDTRQEQETVGQFWARTLPRPRRHSPRKVALSALAAHGNTTWWLIVLAWPYATGLAIALWWLVRLGALLVAGLAHMTLTLAPHAIKAAICVLACLWLAAQWLVWHIDQLTANPHPSNAPPLATA